MWMIQCVHQNKGTMLTSTYLFCKRQVEQDLLEIQWKILWGCWAKENNCIKEVHLITITIIYIYIYMQKKSEGGRTETASNAAWKFLDEFGPAKTNLSCKHKSHGLRDLLFTGQSCSNRPTLEVRHDRLQRSNHCYFFLPFSFPNQDQLLVVNIQLNTFLPRNYCVVFFVFFF